LTIKSRKFTCLSHGATEVAAYDSFSRLGPISSPLRGSRAYFAEGHSGIRASSSTEHSSDEPVLVLKAKAPHDSSAYRTPIYQRDNWLWCGGHAVDSPWHYYLGPRRV